jgi:hypothetical protein
MESITDAVIGMKNRLRHECERMEKVRNEMASLAAEYNRFVDLRRELAERKERAERIMAVLGPHEVKILMKADKAVKSSIELGAPAEYLRDELPLWEAMKEYLHHVSETRIQDMIVFFTSIGMKNANRQAIESALRRHPDMFKTRKAGHEKFISLKD